MSARRAPRIGASGQATVELALTLPFVALLLLAVIQVALLAHQQVLVVHSTREAARAAAVVDDPAEARLAASIAFARAAQLDPTNVGLRTTIEGDDVVVAVVYRSGTDVPLIGPLLGDIELGATATMRREVAVVGVAPP